MSPSLFNNCYWKLWLAILINCSKGKMSQIMRTLVCVFPNCSEEHFLILTGSQTIERCS